MPTIHPSMFLLCPHLPMPHIYLHYANPMLLCTLFPMPSLHLCPSLGHLSYASCGPSICSCASVEHAHIPAPMLHYSYYHIPLFYPCPIPYVSPITIGPLYALSAPPVTHIVSVCPLCNPILFGKGSPLLSQ